MPSWLELVFARRCGSKKAARGCPRIQIWSHEGPNQTQNHGSESHKKPWFCSSGKQEGQGSKRTRTTPCASETGHFLFVPARTRTLEKRHAKLMNFDKMLTIFDRNLSKLKPKCSGPAFFVEILARPKIWRLVSTNRTILRLVSTRGQVLTDIVKLARGLSQATRTTGGESERRDRFSIILMSEPLMPEACLGKYRGGPSGGMPKYWEMVQNSPKTAAF